MIGSAKKGFTLVELLIAAGILVILATTVVLVINPVEYMKQSRDTKRIGDLDALDSALKSAIVDNYSILNGISSSTVYVSLVDSTSTCANLGLPALPPSWSYRCVTNSANVQKTDGTGWVPINLSQARLGSPMATLPIDPVNATTSDQYYLLIIAPPGHWLVSSALEAQKNTGIDNIIGTDGGSSAYRYEMGTDVALDPIFGDMRGLVGYWPLSEGAGTTVADKSRNGNTGTLSGNTAWVDGIRSGIKAVSFGAPTASIGIGTSPALLPSSVTITAWIKPGVVSAPMWSTIFSNTNGWDGGNGVELDLSGGTIMGTIYAAGVNNTAFSVGVVPDNGPWQTISFTYDGPTGAAAIYQNSVLDSSSFIKPNAVQTPAAYPNTIGRQGNPSATKDSTTFPGAIANMRIYNRALSRYELANIYRLEQRQ